VYSLAVAVATYPGTVSPLRGLDPFGEAERDVWHGRETERDELSRMVTADQFRAGLLFGEPGVGKTSLVRAGLIPDLRDHGIVALACEDLAAPAQSFAIGLSAFGIQPNAGEPPIAFITRAVSNSVQGQQFVFVIDDVDLACHDEQITAELSELFTKVVSRSAGRARFLFVCASERLNVLGALERRTGSLFPPSTRYELTRFAPQAASAVLDRVLSLSGVAADPALAEAVVQGLGQGRGLLAADLQIAAMAMRDLRVTSLPALQKLGGPTELESAWLHEACRATGNERSALRLCAELAQGTHGPRPADAVIRRVSVDAAFAQQAFGMLEQRGVIVRGDASGTSWMLRHEVLTVRVRELTAPARAAARRAHDLLGSKTTTRERLTLRELYALRMEGIAPVSPQEIDVVQRSRRHYLTIAGVAGAIPIIILIAILISMRGRVFFDLEQRPGGERVLVRGGRAGLSAFGWLPGGGYGEVIADTGLTRTMVAPEMWKKVHGRDLGSGRGDWDGLLGGLMAPQLAGLVDYATTGSDDSLDTLRKAAEKNPEDLAELLAALRPIARGTPAEIKLVEAALAMPSPAVQRAAVAVAGAAAQRRDVYKPTLVQALTSGDAELRRIAFSSVRSLGDRGQALFKAALANDPDVAARRELLVEVSGSAADDGPPTASAISVLADAEASAGLRERAKGQLKSAFAQDAGAAAAAVTEGLIANDRAPVEARTFAIELLRELDTLPQVAELADAVRGASGSRSLALRAAALPLFAKVDPERAGGELTQMLDDKKLDKPLRVAAALAWGEVAAANKDAASGALDRLLRDDDNDVRAAAATAAGKLGRTYQDRLVKMAKTESYVVRIGAAEGLALTAVSGASGPVAISGIAQLWKEKGRPRRDAAKIYAKLAKKKPGYVMDYLASAARSTEDPSLHAIGVEGLCHAALVGSPDARRALARSTDNPSVEVRRLVMQCVADGPEPAKNGAAIAARLIRDPDPEIRATAASVLALTVGNGNKVAGSLGEALLGLLDDADRDVRLIGIRAVGGLGSDAPKGTAPAMAKLFERADESEKLALLRSAKQLGAADLVALAIADASPVVRTAAVEIALSAGLRPAESLSAALADADGQVRKAALERLAAQKDKLDPQVIDRALSLAVRDPDPELSQLALTTIARIAPKETVIPRLNRALASRVERVRAQAAAAAIGLVEREVQLTVELLEPLLNDPSHDVRVAMLPALAAAYAKTHTAEKLVDLLAGSETHAMRRLVAAGAFVTLARTDRGREASETMLKKASASGPPMSRFTAKLVAGLIAGRADGMAFLQELVP
jgi:HEAT repeat protein